MNKKKKTKKKKTETRQKAEKKRGNSARRMKKRGNAQKKPSKTKQSKTQQSPSVAQLDKHIEEANKKLQEVSAPKKGFFSRLFSRSASQKEQKKKEQNNEERKEKVQEKIPASPAPQKISKTSRDVSSGTIKAKNIPGGHEEHKHGPWILDVIKRKEDPLFRVMKRIKQREEQLRKEQMLKRYLEQSGSQRPPEEVSRFLFNFAIGVNLIISTYLLVYFSTSFKTGVEYVLAVMSVLWTVAFLAVLLLLWLGFFIILDLRIFRRTKDVEEVFADFLQLTAANVRAGMTIDQALWQAIRPRFGVLANEIEDVAKRTISGQDLKASLLEFSQKYDSELVRRSIALLVEGIDAGGEVGGLLEKIARDIEEIKATRAEMAANVTTYVIFISFATMIGAPVLFALASQLLFIVQSLIRNLGPVQTAGLPFSFSPSAGGLTGADFLIFAVMSLAVTSIFSAVIVALIRKGSVRGGVKYIPAFLIVSIAIFFLARLVLGGIFAGIVPGT